MVLSTLNLMNRGDTMFQPTQAYLDFLKDHSQNYGETPNPDGEELIQPFEFSDNLDITDENE